ncbi:DUF5684 domain-containing protein [Pseudodesulfovibrio sp.]|uniref:DUF5684 domain-containing protein n=1 Tax=unclassified Pseudodesulfovibrio TaxID=2661612 RepID=UPI003B007F2D
MGIISLLLCIIWFVGMWKVFAKAGEPGWAAIIPFYNLWVLVRIARKPWWWFIGLFIPLVNLVVLLLISLGVANKFGQPFIFGVALFCLPFIFYIILGFSDMRYRTY